MDWLKDIPDWIKVFFIPTLVALSAAFRLIWNLGKKFWAERAKLKTVVTEENVKQQENKAKAQEHILEEQKLKNEVSLLQQVSDLQEEINQVHDEYRVKIKNLNDRIEALERSQAQKDTNFARLLDQLEKSQKEVKSLKQQLDKPLAGYSLVYKPEGKHRATEHHIPLWKIDEEQEMFTLTGSSLIKNDFLHSVYKPVIALLPDYFTRHDRLTVVISLDNLNSQTHGLLKDMYDVLEHFHGSSDTVPEGTIARLKNDLSEGTSEGMPNKKILLIWEYEDESLLGNGQIIGKGYSFPILYKEISQNHEHRNTFNA